MPTLLYRTAGESHGKALITLVEGMPAGVQIDVELIDHELLRRQGGYGRGPTHRRTRLWGGCRRRRTRQATSPFAWSQPPPSSSC